MRLYIFKGVAIIWDDSTYDEWDINEDIDPIPTPVGDIIQETSSCPGEAGEEPIPRAGRAGKDRDGEPRRGKYQHFVWVRLRSTFFLSHSSEH